MLGDIAEENIQVVGMLDAAKQQLLNRLFKKNQIMKAIKQYIAHYSKSKDQSQDANLKMND